MKKELTLHLGTTEPEEALLTRILESIKQEHDEDPTEWQTQRVRVIVSVIFEGEFQ